LTLKYTMEMELGKEYSIRQSECFDASCHVLQECNLKWRKCNLTCLVLKRMFSYTGGNKPEGRIIPCLLERSYCSLEKRRDIPRKSLPTS
jgi:hypothetical protein